MSFALTSINSSNQYVTLTMDGGSKPSGTWKYGIERKEKSASDWLSIKETTSAVYVDHPRPTDTAGTQIEWNYRVRAYIFIGGWTAYLPSPIVDTAIATVTDGQIASSGILGSVTSAGSFNNTYITQGESMPTTGANLDRNTWVVTEILPLTISSA